MSTRSIDFLRSRRTPLLGWLLLVAGVLAAGQAARLEQRLEAARDSHDRAQAQLEHDEEQARQRQEAASRPTPESHRLAGAAAEVMPPSTVIAVGGGLGALAACGLTLRWRELSPAVGRHSARHLSRQASLTGQTPVHTARSH